MAGFLGAVHRAVIVSVLSQLTENQPGCGTDSEQEAVVPPLEPGQDHVQDVVLMTLLVLAAGLLQE